MTKTAYNEFTELEKAFIRKAYESKIVSEMSHLRNAVLNAINNAMRKKGKKFLELFKKRQEKADKEFNQNAITIIHEIEAKEGKSWVDKVYKGAGLKMPKRKEGE